MKEPCVNSLASPEPYLPHSIDALLTSMQMWDSEFEEKTSNKVNPIAISEDGITLGGELFPAGSNTIARLLKKVRAPAEYVMTRAPAVWIEALKQHLEDGDFGPTPNLILHNRQPFTIHRGDLVELSLFETVRALSESLPRDVDLSVTRIEYNAGQMGLELVSQTESMEVRSGDVVHAGLHIRHSRYSEEATQIYPFIHRLICRNGMFRRECISRKGIVRTRKLPTTHPRAQEQQLDQIRRLAAQTWETLEAHLLELRQTSSRPADVERLLRQWLQKARISTNISVATTSNRTIMDRLLAAWRAEGAENTYYGAVNALTRVGSHDLELTRRQRRVLTLLGGLLAFSAAHICPRCFSVISDSGLPTAA